LELEEELLPNTRHLAVVPSSGIKNQHPIEDVRSVDIKSKGDKNKMEVPASDGVEVISTLGVALEFATEGFRKFVFGKSRIHLLKVAQGIRRPNEYMVWKVPWHSLLEDDVDQRCRQETGVIQSLD
jgi:hypothetical protein